MLNEKRITMSFYRTPAGNEPVREWLKSMSKDDREIIGKDLLKIELGFPIGMPLCRSLGDGLWECRSDLSQNRIARVIFCVSENRLVALHGFIKKTQKTPPSEIDLALKRKKESEL
jgi:phage-related protein